MTFPDPKQARGATPLSYPYRSRPVSETDPGFVSTAVNDWEPESVTGLVDTVKTFHIGSKTVQALHAQS